jgi:ATP dependent DNA ligase domain
MAPTLVREPFHRDGWVYEEKVDGWRMLAYKDRDRVRLVSRNGVNHTKRFPDLATAIAKLSARTLVLDGEVAIFDQQLARWRLGCHCAHPAGLPNRSHSQSRVTMGESHSLCRPPTAAARW